MSHITAELMGFFNNMKVCSKCNIEKDFIEFSKDKSRKDGLFPQCKSCKRTDDKKSYFKNRDKVIANSKKWTENNKEYRKEYRRQYNIKNKEIENKKCKDWYKNNKDKVNEWYRNKIATDPLFKLTSNIRGLIRISIKGNGYTKKSKTYQILGCSFEDFKQHLESQFTEGMTWENQGKWHMDHIYPVSLAKNEEDIVKLNHYTNFQPLWAEDNIKKSNKLIIK